MALVAGEPVSQEHPQIPGCRDGRVEHGVLGDAAVSHLGGVELPLHLGVDALDGGAVGVVVGPDGGICEVLAGRTVDEVSGVDLHHPAALGFGAALPQGTAGTVALEGGPPLGGDGGGVPCRAGEHPGLLVQIEVVDAESTRHRHGERMALDHRCVAPSLQIAAELSGGVPGVAVDDHRFFLLFKESLGRGGIGLVAFGEGGLCHHFGIGLHRDMALVAIQVAAARLVGMTRGGIHHRYHPVAGHLGGDGESSGHFVDDLHILSGDQGQEPDGLLLGLAEFEALTRLDQGVGVADQFGDGS